MTSKSAIGQLLRGEEGVLRERETGGKREGSRLVIEDRVDAASLDRLEKTLGWTFPEDYRFAVTEIGLAKQEYYWQGERENDQGRWLAPQEIEELLEKYKTWIADCSSEYEDDPEGAAEQQAYFDRLVPFQYVDSDNVTDLHCFVRGDMHEGRTRVVTAYHDDEVMTEWNDEPLGERTYGFTEHVRWWLSDQGEASA